ncbi:alpha/beta fold hydrolase [Frigidibacter albus]|uniref:Alpha/beta fold hydrolase n=1 Tax=Frigidibacter albus TaxID=1465486 RepID=A0A6L8VL97_9RHOB|nr:alpha/beta fold hydrolase [Frigidibacter albus]MZQ89930.1 alpha/beta fold hydrolase [Frigidibacter albus]NBE31695.1 alpha/beta fold hydrolase [Frigidibacter albus]GGH55931.1 hydrolase [Frigidibacter albus]
MIGPTPPATGPEPLLLIPGLMMDARAFWHQIITVSALRPVQVACLGTLPSVEEMARAVLEHAPPRFAVAGHWLGALVAMEILKRAPERVTRIALMDVNPLPENPQVAAAREPRLVGARAGRLAEMMLQEVPASTLAPGPGLDEVQAILLDMADALGVDAYLAQSRALVRRPDHQRTLRTARLPALVLCGEHDTLCPVRRHEFLAELMPHARFELIRNAGHLPMLEQPEAVTAALLGWLSAPLLLR